MSAAAASPDQHLIEAARAMIGAAERGEAVLTLLRSRCPHIARQISADKNHPALLALWGRSVNVDENTGEVIVQPAILEAIGELAGLPMRGRFVHAGLQHTYGYLFSLIDTPYGRKRDRWLSPNLENGFGLDASLLSDQPARGTLLANLTAFLVCVVHRDQDRYRSLVRRHAQAVAPQIIAYDYHRLAVFRIVEETAKMQLLTDLVALPLQRRPADPRADGALLIYSVKPAGRPLRLITAFPIADETMRQLRSSALQGGSAQIRLRYNAYVRGLHGRSMRGRRYLA